LTIAQAGASATTRPSFERRQGTRMADTPAPASAVVTSDHDRGVVLLDTAAGVLFSANETGARVWRGLQAHLPLDAIVADLGREYGIAPGVATGHVTAFVDELERQGLLATGVRR
jgi:Coenzyme PQQ synthesis protein D (PqqD)